MNKDTVKGGMDDMAGRVKRQAGEWTGDINKQMEGAGQQVKGKAEKAWGHAKDAARDMGSQANNDPGRNAGSTNTEHNRNDSSNHRTH